MAAKIVFRLLRQQTLRLNSQMIRSRTLYTSQKCFSLDSKKEDTYQESRTTHFGFETVKEDDKQEKVYEVFHNVAEKYDTMNDAMSGGIHRLWKDHFMEQLAPTPGTKLIDVAGGTGDIAFRFLQYLENATGSSDTYKGDYDVPNIYSSEPTDGSSSESSSDECDLHTRAGKHVTVCDINQAMLDVGQTRAQNLGYNTGISWLKGNAECLPVPDNSYDAYTIAFGIRNTTHIDKVLCEAFRVLKPGGRFMCLEFSHVPNPLLRWVYDEYSFQVIPVMGQVIAGDWKSYQYLVESIRKFPKQDEFSSMIRGAGFKAVTYDNLMFGVAAIHSGFKL